MGHIQTPMIHRGMVLGQDGKWRRPHHVKRLSNQCPTHPAGFHVFTSWRKIGQGPRLPICSWCAKPKA